MFIFATIFFKTKWNAGLSIKGLCINNTPKWEAIIKKVTKCDPEEGVFNIVFSLKTS